MAAEKPPPRTNRERRTALSHIAYEVAALRGASQVFAKHRRRLDLEAALVHARNLIEFFWAPSPRLSPHPDGVYAVHFVDAGSWKARRSSLPQRPRQRNDALCAQLSHISVKRSRRNFTINFGAGLRQLCADLDTAWCIFENELASSTWASTLARARARWSRINWDR